jgi:hypothetical protein
MKRLGSPVGRSKNPARTLACGMLRRSSTVQGVRGLAGIIQRRRSAAQPCDPCGVPAVRGTTRRTGVSDLREVRQVSQAAIVANNSLVPRLPEVDPVCETVGAAC